MVHVSAGNLGQKHVNRHKASHGDVSLLVLGLLHKPETINSDGGRTACGMSPPPQFTDSARIQPVLVVERIRETS